MGSEIPTRMETGLNDPPTDRVIEKKGLAACEECGGLLCVKITTGSNPLHTEIHSILSNSPPAENVVSVHCAGCGHVLFRREKRGGKNVL